LLDRLDTKGLIANIEDTKKFILTKQDEKGLPIYLHILAGIGAFIASVCFISFLFAAEIVDLSSEEEMILFGILFVAAAIFVKSAVRSKGSIKYSFIIQTSFVTMVVGKILFVTGMGSIMDSGWGASFALLIITALTYIIYKMPIDRFLSSFATLLSILLNILWNRDLPLPREFLFNGFFLLQMTAAAILFTNSKIKREHLPLSYAFALSLCATILHLAFPSEFVFWRAKRIIDPIFINVMLSIGLIGLIAWAAGGIEKLKKEPLRIACLGVVLFGLISAPGIILAIGLLILGYVKHERLLILMGTLLMPVFLFTYYYNLNFSLYKKSTVLILSGIVLLMGRAYLKYKKWDEKA
jgi:hypothetical protein